MGLDYIKEQLSHWFQQSSMLRCLVSSLQPASAAYCPSPMASSGQHDSCPANSPWSCSSGSQDTCCYEGSNGLFLQTQFWDYSPASGPDDVWTIHGLWSDKCSGGYRQFCNPSWEVSDARSTLSDLGLSDLIAVMDKNWKNQGNSDDSLWTHEFNKHGTCMSTVDPSCYPSDSGNQNVGDFFKRVVSLWQTLPTYDWLKSAGIEPSTTKTWTVAELSSALVEHTNGKTVYLGCDKNNAINELWYFFSLKGSVADGEFRNIDSISTSSCTDGFYYLPKGSSKGGNGGDNGGSTSSGSLNVYQQGASSPTGCLISDGSWFTSGTCATYKVSSSVGGVQLKSSRGSCGIVNNKFTCGSGVTASDFTMSGSTLVYGGESQWSASGVPSSSQRQSVEPDADAGTVITIKLE